jgi:hypothetical protein
VYINLNGFYHMVKSRKQGFARAPATDDAIDCGGYLRIIPTNVHLDSLLENQECNPTDLQRLMLAIPPLSIKWSYNVGNTSLANSFRSKQRADLGTHPLVREEILRCMTTRQSRLVDYMEQQFHLIAREQPVFREEKIFYTFLVSPHKCSHNVSRIASMVLVIMFVCSC